MTELRGTQLAAAAVPFTDEDTFATHYAKYGNGGWQEVATTTARDAITTDRREAGMAVYVTGEGKLYILGSDLETWTVFETGKIDKIKVNGTEQAIVDKTVDITVPTKISDLTDDTATNPVDKADTLTNLTATVTELNYTDGVTSNIQTQLDSKQATLTAGTNITIEDNEISATDTTYSAGNGLTLSGTTFSANVQNNVTSTSTTDALSANMGKELNDRIDNLESIGKFLSGWNCATGLPTTDPTTEEYTYNTGDYFFISNVATGEGAVNYRPNGNKYTRGVASTTVETDEIAVGDIYLYDSTNWLLLKNTQKTVSFSQIAGQPTDNANLATALNAKANDDDVLHKTAGAETVISNSTNGYKTFNNAIKVGNPNNSTYSTFTTENTGELKIIANAKTSGMRFNSQVVEPLSDNLLYLGSSSKAWKGLFLKGSINKSGYNFTFPSKSGTFALTDDIQIVQVSTMPAPSTEYNNKIVQYVGATTTDYTNGYFYKCTYSEIPASVTIEATVGAERYENFTVDVSKMIAHYPTGADNYFKFEEAQGAMFAGEMVWRDYGMEPPYELPAGLMSSIYGIEYDNIGSVEQENDVLHYVVTPAIGTGGWTRVNVQPEGALYTAGTGLTLSGTEFSVDTSVIQPKLTVGTNITITDNEISATDTTYTAGTGLSLTGTEFSVDTDTIQEKLTAGNNVTINNNVVSARDTTYLAGTNIEIANPSYIVEGYKALKYVESDGTGYINTGHKYLSTSVITMEAKGSYNYPVGDEGVLAGMAGQTTYDNSAWFIVSSNYQSGVSMAGVGYIWNSANEIEVLKIDIPQGKGYWNGNDVVNQNITPEDLDVYLFARNRNGTPDKYAKGRIRSYVQEDNGVKVLDLHACKRESDNAVGFYDLVSETFITCAGLTAGPDLYTDQYVINCTAEGSTYTAGTGIDITDDEISVDDNVFRNVGTGTESWIEHKCGNSQVLTKEGVTLVGNGAVSDDYGTVFGDLAGAGRSGVAVGFDAQSSNDASISIGQASVASGECSVALGGGNGSDEGAKVQSAQGIAIGNKAKVSTSQAGSIAIGSGSKSAGANAVAIGGTTNFSAEYETAAAGACVAIGYRANANYINCIAIGGSDSSGTTSTNAEHSIAIGYRCTTTNSATYSMAIGQYTNTTGTHAIAIGSAASYANRTRAIQYSVAIGYQAVSQDEGAIVIGKEANSRDTGGSGSTNGIAIGTSSKANANAVAIGYSASTLSNGVGIGPSSRGSSASVGIGYNAKTYPDYAVAIGNYAEAQNNASNGVAIGNHATSKSSYAVSMGYYAGNTTSGAYSVAVGNVANAAYQATAVGDGAVASGYGSVAIGHAAKTSVQDAIQLGQGTNNSSGTLKFKSYELVHNDGSICADRLADTTSAEEGQVLKLAGSGMEWGDIDGLPSQSGQSGKFLTTNGTTASWATVPTPTYNAETETIEF